MEEGATTNIVEDAMVLLVGVELVRDGGEVVVCPIWI
jgi:hypothetical protein